MEVSGQLHTPAASPLEERISWYGFVNILTIFIDQTEK
jgi:hypothetical protein